MFIEHTNSSGANPENHTEGKYSPEIYERRVSCDHCSFSAKITRNFFLSTWMQYFTFIFLFHTYDYIYCIFVGRADCFWNNISVKLETRIDIIVLKHTPNRLENICMFHNTYLSFIFAKTHTQTNNKIKHAKKRILTIYRLKKKPNTHTHKLVDKQNTTNGIWLDLTLHCFYARKKWIYVCIMGNISSLQKFCADELLQCIHLHHEKRFVQQVIVFLSSFIYPRTWLFMNNSACVSRKFFICFTFYLYFIDMKFLFKRVYCSLIHYSCF